jgi:hypothetical protein
MTEEEWLACDDPEAARKALRGKVTDRKLRLFACACVRHIWHLLTDPRSRGAVEAAERSADGFSGKEELQAARSEARDAIAANYPYMRIERAHYVRVAARDAAREAAASAAKNAPASATYALDGDSLNPRAALERRWQAALLGDLLGNPFRPLTLDPAWRTADVIALAQAAYEERDLPSGQLDPQRLAILADALEDAGCTDAQLLGHLRGEGPHWKGCFAVDAVLGKS